MPTAYRSQGHQNSKQPFAANTCGIIIRPWLGCAPLPFASSGSELLVEATGFYWQGGYGAFSVSPGHVDQLRHYISDQENHHRTETFQEEFRRICQKYGVEIDERYAWD